LANKIDLQIQWLDLGMREFLPQYQSELAAGMDVCAAQPLALKPGARGLVPCGFAMAIPKGYEVQVRPRSGLAMKHGITVLNAPGTIDADYRGELKVLLINLGEKIFEIQRGDRVAQMIIAPVAQAQWIEKVELEETIRGDGGFGHTGV
jgi:dUTP pyrophosphatase